MKKMKKKRLAIINNLMEELNIKDALLIINKQDRDFFAHPVGDEELLKQLTASYCRKQPILQHFLMEIIRLSAGADALFVEKEGPPKGTA
jgi:hypothetical protein